MFPPTESLTLQSSQHNPSAHLADGFNLHVLWLQHLIAPDFLQS